MSDSVINKCYDLIEGGAMIDAEQITEQYLLHQAVAMMSDESKTKFMNKFKALQNGESYDESDYVENKLTDENLGFKMLARMGWSEGKGLGQDGQGITAPVGQ